MKFQQTCCNAQVFFLTTICETTDDMDKTKSQVFAPVADIKY